MEIVCWSNGKRNIFYRYEILKYIKKGKKHYDDVTRSANYIFNLYQPQLSKYYTIKHKNINGDVFSENENNRIVVTFLEVDNIIYYLKNMPNDVCDFAKKHNLEIFLCYVEFPLTRDEIKKFDDCYAQYCLNDEFKSKNIKLILNSFDILKESSYPHIFILFDAYRYLMRHYLEYFKLSDIKKVYPFLEKRKYDFSLLVGRLTGSFERTIILNDLYENGLLDDRFFHTLICDNKEDTADYINSKLDDVDCHVGYNMSSKNSIRKNMDIFLQNKIYDFDGNLLPDGSNVYYDGMQYKVPIQVSDSYIHIVFETYVDPPSIGEKIYKPIVSGVPFVWLGPVNIMKYLESRGFKMYPFINYDFDSIDDISLRVEFLINEIKRLKELGSNELRKLVNECKDISLHNQEIFLKTTENIDDVNGFFF